MRFSLKQIIGAALIDVPLFEFRLRSSWQRICNRDERLIISTDGRGVACDWKWTSDLYAPKVFPDLSVRLMARCMRDWPINFASAPQDVGGQIQVSFIIGHRGHERLPLLLSTLATVAAQRDVVCECIVVEQSKHSEIAGLLPPWVRYVHTPLPDPDMPYCRSWALNVGARKARGKILVLHDNDLLVPQSYAAELLARAVEGYDVVNLKRFIFYVNETHSGAICTRDRDLLAMPAETIMQNAEAGGSIGVSRDAFFAIGGFDEAFVGWGGEDNEFWQRALTLKTWPYAYMPFVHLWHAPQFGKQQQNPAAVRRFQDLASIAPELRIEVLVQRKIGDAQRMDPPWQPEAA